MANIRKRKSNYQITVSCGRDIYGKQMDPSTPYRVFKGVIHRYNQGIVDEAQKLSDIPLHGPRHTSATLLIRQKKHPAMECFSICRKP